MNYRHAYHAGNFADVVKHSALLAVLQALHRKPAPLCYLDTHAGRGVYDLRSEPAQRSGEHTGGIALLQHAAARNPILMEFMLLVNRCNTLRGSQDLRWYPGSCELAVMTARPNDRTVLCELHPEECAALQDLYADRRDIAIHQQDGYLGLKAFLPPRERRGLVLVDPPYETPDEAQLLLSRVRLGWERWQTGVFMIWYPIKERAEHDGFVRMWRDADIPRTLCAEFLRQPLGQAPGLAGSGLIIINPPWQLDVSLRDMLGELREILAPGFGRVRVEWLRGED